MTEVRHARLWVALLAVAWFGGCRFSPQKVDLVVRNATIHTMDGRGGQGQAMAIDSGRVVAVGKEYEVLNAYRGVETFDAKGQTIYPGLMDAHSHLIGYAQGLDRINAVGTASWQEVVDLLDPRDGTGWVRGRGWDQNDWDDRAFPDRAKLDSLFPDRPVVLQRIDGHAVIANGQALRQTGMMDATSVAGGEILRRPDGSPTGVLIDGAADSLLSRIPSPSRAQTVDALKKAERNLVRLGLTTVTDAGLDWPDLALLDSLHRSGVLSLRVMAMANPTAENLEVMASRGGWDTPRLKAQSFKFYMDGALGSRGAALLEPYDDRPGHKGMVLQDLPSYLDMLYQVKASGFQACTHAIGDSANRLVLDAYAEVLEGVNDERWRIEHAQVVHPQDMDRFGAYSVIPSVQPTHATSDMYWAGERLGRGRVRRAYAYQDLLGQLGMLPLGTDFPVEGIDPRKTFLAAVARQDANRYPKEGYHLDQGLTPEQALAGMTLWAAMSSHMDDELGSLEPGKWADFVVVDRDWLNLEDVHEVLNAQVLQTFIQGEPVWDADNP